MRAARLLLLALIVVACGNSAAAPSPSPAGHTITGTLVLHNGDEYVVRHGLGSQYYSTGHLPAPDNVFPCAGTSGFSDIQSGMQLQALNESGTIIATTTVTDDVAATYAAFPKVSTDLAKSPLVKQCFFAFTLENVPSATFYTFKIGTRGGPAYSAADLESKGWQVALTLGT